MIRAVKRVLRGATPEHRTKVHQDLEATLGAAEADDIWQESETVFGGYTGMYPGYATDVKGILERLGISETLPFGTFELQRDGPAEHRSDAERIAAGELADLARTDILYFRGHQFAQYRAPGVFSNYRQTYGFDLRYIEQVGGIWQRQAHDQHELRHALSRGLRGLPQPVPQRRDPRLPEIGS